MTDSTRMDAFFHKLEEDTKKHGRSNLMETAAMAAIGGSLGWLAYGTVAHVVLFALVIFPATGAGNRVMGELLRQRAQDEARRLLGEQEGSQAIVRDLFSVSDYKAAMENDNQLRLKWRRTWPDDEREREDFVAEADSYTHGNVCRIYQSAGKASWFWSMMALDDEVSRNCGALSGYEPTAREAAAKAEAAWFGAIRGTSHELPPVPAPSTNAYAAAKDPG